MDNIIDVKNITIKYGKHKVVNNLSFSVSKGEFCSIIGPNGAGKSTILKSIMKNLSLDKGDIYINGKNINEITHKQKAKIIGFVPQDYYLSFDFSVYDIVAMGRNPYIEKFKKSNFDDEKIIEDVLIKTNTIELKEKSFNSLSGGEKQRVIIARALAQQPEILILDEATSNLDIHHQLDILELIYSLNREDNMTVLTIMHDLNLAARFSDKVILLDKSGIVKTGSPDEVMCEDVLKQVYDMEMIVRDNKLLCCKEIVPLRIRKQKQEKALKIHVICGGGTGEYIVQRLYTEGYNISCGILNEGDSDLELCKSLKIKTVTELPFTQFSTQCIEECKKYINNSNIIILTDVAIGHGNIVNIKMITDINDKQIIILHNENRDFVNGDCDKLIKYMLTKPNVKYAMNLKELFETIKNSKY